MALAVESPAEHAMQVKPSQPVEESDEEWSASPVRGAADCPAPLAGPMLDAEQLAANHQEQCASPEPSPIRALQLASLTPSPVGIHDTLEAADAMCIEEKKSGCEPSQGDESAQVEAEAVEVSWLQRLSCTADDLGFLAAFRQLQTSGALRTPRPAAGHDAAGQAATTYISLGQLAKQSAELQKHV